MPRPVFNRLFHLPLFALGCVLCLSSGSAQTVAHVFHISVDGLRPDAVTALGPSNLPHFYRLRAKGAFTDNARTDYDFTVTLPDHATQLTGRAVLGPAGHNWTSNDEPPPGQTLASNKGSYIAGVFDVVHDHGLSTGLYASKPKFSLFATSWDAINGGPDVIGPDDGRNKIDLYVNNPDTAELVNTLTDDLSSLPLNYVFLHLADPDHVGHNSGWDITPGSEYSNAVRAIDDRLAAIFDLIDSDTWFAGRTAIVLTADHGGEGGGHADPSVREDYTVPFYVWAPGVKAGADLYALNPTKRLDPSTDRPDYSAPVQPIRNGEAANVALQLLGLGPVPGSTIDAAQDLALTVMPPADFRAFFIGTDLALAFTTISNMLYDIQISTDLRPDSWSSLTNNIVGTGGTVTNLDTGTAASACRFYRLRLHD